MMFSPVWRKARSVILMSAACSAIALSGCSTSTPGGSDLAEVKPERESKEYFSEAEYGVKASPRVVKTRVAAKGWRMPLVGGKDTRLPGMSVEKAEVLLASMPRSRMPRGGGRYQVGKPYQVKGKWYRPKEDPNYKAVGLASWYGSAFHGRLTANGEVYDMTHLTAAHPTMPLPSYARVTNLKNGSSVMVRVNDRGPFAHSRVIDLSKRAAELLDYQHTGLAKVKVEYVGRAPLDGQDDAYLLASYRPGGKAPDPGAGIASGIMVAMAGSTPTVKTASAGRLFETLRRTGEAKIGAARFDPERDPILPAFGPAVPERPGVDVARFGRVTTLSYADTRVARAAGAFRALSANAMTSADVIRSWKAVAGDR